jgi:hypothetical protein
MKPTARPRKSALVLSFYVIYADKFGSASIVVLIRNEMRTTRPIFPQVKNTSLHEGRVKGPTGDWLPSIFTGDSQHITFEGLTPGAIYTVQVRALGGSTGQSDWSDPSTHMAM